MKRPNYLNQIRNIIAKAENSVSMYADPRKGTDAAELSEMLNVWAEQSEKYHNGDINRDEYDKWC